MVKLETQDIQGIILSGYNHLPFSKYLLLHITNPKKAQEWLKQLLPQITNSDWGIKPNIQKPSQAINIAFTYTGIKKLGLPPESLRTFSNEFFEGMAEDNRSRQLGDEKKNSPTNWEFGSPDKKEIDVLLILQAQSPLGESPQSSQEELERLGKEELNKLCHHHRELFVSTLVVGEVVKEEEGYLPSDFKEHFGFHDSISQPEIEGSPKDTKGKQLIKAGEFILGYLNEDGNLPPTPNISAKYDIANTLKPLNKNSDVKDLGRNGSYLVFRKLSQDVVKFRQYFSQFSNPELMAAKVVGRWQSGVPLTLSPDKDHPDLLERKDFDFNHIMNNFNYMETDPHGYRCPFGAHIRRVNPRDSLGVDPQQSIESVNRHRILRRGALYGERLPGGFLDDYSNCREADSKRGLLFLCINSNIRQQFEFIQQTWINNPKFNGFYDEIDPLVSPKSTSMTIPKEPVRERLTIPEFVSVKGGGYFFLPSISALKFLAYYQQ